LVVVAFTISPAIAGLFYFNLVIKGGFILTVFIQV
jgi:hypothetical protein